MTHDQQHPPLHKTTATFISGSNTISGAIAGQSMALQPSRSNILTRSIRTTDYFLKDQQHLAKGVHDDLSAVQSFLGRVQHLSPLQALQFALVRASS